MKNGGDDMDFLVGPEMNSGNLTGNVIVTIEISFNSFMRFYLSHTAADQLSERLAATLLVIDEDEYSKELSLGG